MIWWPVKIQHTSYGSSASFAWIGFLLRQVLLNFAGEAIKIVYVPSHLYHMLFELFKNSMRATMENSSESSSVPPLRVTITNGKEDVCVKVSFGLLTYGTYTPTNMHT